MCITTTKPTSTPGQSEDELPIGNKSHSANQSNNNDIAAANTTTQNNDNMSWTLLRMWRGLYHGSRALVPDDFQRKDLSVTFCTVLLLTSLRFAWTRYLQLMHGWPNYDHHNNNNGSSVTTLNHHQRDLTKEAAASLVAVFHSVCLVPGLLASFAVHAYQPSERLNAAPQHWQESTSALIQFCTGYMLYDGFWNTIILHYGSYDANDFMFLGHHIATVIYMSSTRMIQAGHASAMMCMLLGEITNPLQNLYYVAEHALKLAAHDPQWNMQQVQRVHQILEMLFCIQYISIRAVIGPVVCLHMTYKLIQQDRAIISQALKALWILLIWAVMYGSIPWIQDCWTKLIVQYSQYQGDVVDESLAATTLSSEL